MRCKDLYTAHFTTDDLVVNYVSFKIIHEFCLKCHKKSTIEINHSTPQYKPVGDDVGDDVDVTLVC